MQRDLSRSQGPDQTGLGARTSDNHATHVSGEKTLPLGIYDFYLDSWADWQRTVAIKDATTNLLVPMSAAVMEIRNQNFVLVMRLDAASSRCTILSDGATIALHITAADSLTYFSQGNFPGAVQAVGFWGIGRSYLYDLFATYTASGVQDRIMRGFFNVDPNISRPLDPKTNLALTIGQRGNYE